ncbi:hypothetical protein C8R47DRAFT_141868 [Mycena vitilis]|nr:hypothetical protein C8R47DRAFT_141868 [Mycena vitilis]
MAILLMASPVNSSVFQLTPASAAFIADRSTTLGTWVLAGFLDSILMGVVLCQVATFFKASRAHRGTQSGLHTFYLCIVIAVTFLSLLKTAQAIGVVWMQNVHFFADPDIARTLVAKAWWQVTMPLMTGIIGCLVQIFFCTRFYMLCRTWIYCVPIVCAMCVGLAGGCLSVYSIVAGKTQAKVMWLMVHLIGVFIADLLITTGTFLSLRRRASGLSRTTQLVERLLRMVFESAIPPTVIATTDLILTQTLGTKLLWHLVLNACLGKIYVVSLLYTLNSVNEYRESHDSRDHSHSHGNQRHGTRPSRNNIELSPRGTRSGQLSFQTELGPTSPVKSFPTQGALSKNSYIPQGFVQLQHSSDDITEEKH